MGGSKHENIRYDAPEALGIDDARIGWGLYQTAYEQWGVKRGDGEWHPGIHVRWAVVDAYRTELALCFLLDGTPRPK